MYVMTHKENSYKLPEGYSNLLVGATSNRVNLKGVDNYLYDDTEENISQKNKNYCELTGMYWIWKNSDKKNVGVSHYRRYFSDKSKLTEYAEALFKGWVNPVKIARLDKYLEENDWIVPEKIALEDGEKDLYENYVNFHYEKDLVTTRDVISEIYPEYTATFDRVLAGNEFSQFNMCYTSKEEFDKYCQWLFDILEEVEIRVDIKDYDDYQARIYGFLSERLFNVWLQHDPQKKIKYLPVFDTRTRERSYVAKKILGG
ncbi:DUF4422 domain-containing protein [Ligilactobacillus faecis]|uniref:DUF4422 domain-containing protein n=1 Tax=Ligilactobacillus faecis TaxID=762833 RepID=UPI0024684051|nr:DUF4422 domain-containing protein [Ligilactobacillus faecis]WGN90542.1 DUF4422 domain-containing protein [Ligilactobacillus faecis]